MMNAPNRIRSILGYSPGTTSMIKTTAFIKNIGQVNILQIGEIMKHYPTRNHRRLIMEQYGLEQDKLDEFNLNDEIIDQPISIILGINVGQNQQVIDPTSLNLFNTPVMPSLSIVKNPLDGKTYLP